MIALAIAKKNFIEFFRNFKSNFIVIVLPIFFFAIFAFIFNRDNGSITFPIAVINQQQMAESNQIIIEQLQDLSNTDNASLFITKDFADIESAKNAVLDKSYILYISEKESLGLDIAGDQRNLYYNSAASIITEVANKVNNINSDLITKVSIESNSRDEFSGFDYLVPGLIVYGLLIMIPYNTGLLTELVATKKIFRVFLSYATGKDIILGYIISQTALALFQTFLLFLVAKMWGFETNANLLSVLIISIPTNLFIIGSSLLIGGFVKDVNNAVNVGTIASVILGFMSGSFIVGIENITRIGEFMGRQFSLNQIFPSTFATQAWSQLLLYNKNLTDISFELIALTLSSIIILIVGIIVYNKKQLNRIS